MLYNLFIIVINLFIKFLNIIILSERVKIIYNWWVCNGIIDVVFLWFCVNVDWKKIESVENDVLIFKVGYI